jgi:Outer membrane protein beta-barrel domain
MRDLFKVWLVVSLLALLALSAAPAFAQAPASQQPPPPPRQTSTRSSGAEGFGIQLGGGPIFSSLDDAQGLDLKTKTGWLAGLLMGGNRGGTVGVEADVLYGEKGAKFSVPGGTEQEFTQHVVHVPVMLKLNGGSGNANGLSVFGLGGGFFDWQFSSKINDVDITGDTSGYEVGWLVGGGVEVLRFSVQARYAKGVRQISKNFDVANTFESNSKAFVVLVAFRLN